MSDRPRAEPSRRAVAETLVKQSKPDEVVAWFCTNCGTVYKSKDDAERCVVRNRHWHRHCPRPDSIKSCTNWACEDCGVECTAFQWYCHKCIDKHRTDPDDEKLAKAEVVENYPSDQGVFWNGDYHQSIEDLIDHCEYNGIDIPDRVWATSPTPFSVSADNVLEHAFEQWSEGCEDAEPCYSGEDDFRAAVKSFNEANSNKLLYFKTSKAVDLTTHQVEED